MTFEVTAFNLIETRIGWQHIFECFSICRGCNRSTVFILRLRDSLLHSVIESRGPQTIEKLDGAFDVTGVVNLKDLAKRPAPEYLPPALHASFNEGAACLAVGCWNASAVMFRMCIDIATRAMLPAEGVEPGPNAKERRDLGLRLPWLFSNGLLPEGLRDLSACVHQDGNDGAHQGTLTEVDAEDLIDFTEALLNRLYTEPERLRLAAIRREERRAPKQ